MVRSGWTLLAEQGFATDIGMTVWRVLGGFVLAAILAVPLGVAMGEQRFEMLPPGQVTVTCVGTKPRSS